MQAARKAEMALEQRSGVDEILEGNHGRKIARSVAFPYPSASLEIPWCSIFL
jgi:hypothetical protein